MYRFGGKDCKVAFAQALSGIFLNVERRC